MGTSSGGFGEIAEQEVDSISPQPASPNQQIIDTPEGQFTITFTPKEKSETVQDRTSPQTFGNGYLSVEQANLILNHLPLELTFVNKDDIFQYYNDSHPVEDMIFKRTPSQIGRHVELCHPPKIVDKVKKIFELLRTGQKTRSPCGSSPRAWASLSMWSIRQCVMTKESFKAFWSMFRIFNHF